MPAQAADKLLLEGVAAPFSSSNEMPQSGNASATNHRRCSSSYKNGS